MDNLYFADINECDRANAGCQYQCVNEVGSYKCKCPDGFHLKEDGKACQSMSHEPTIFTVLHLVCLSKELQWKCFCSITMATTVMSDVSGSGGVGVRSVALANYYFSSSSSRVVVVSSCSVVGVLFSSSSSSSSSSSHSSSSRSNISSLVVVVVVIP